MSDMANDLSPEELERRSEEARLSRLRRQEASASTLQPGELWLALAPRWTLASATAAEIPLGDENVGAALERRREAGELSLRRDGYTMHDSFRSAVLDRVLADSNGGLSLVLRTLQKIGERLGGGVSQTDEPDPMLSRWASLAALAETPSRMVEQFDERIAAALAEHSPAEVENWIEAARPMAVWLSRDGDVSMELAIQRAGQQLELLHRENADRRYLHEFFVRREQIAAVHKLMFGNDEEWALHLIGVGGVGKTMLIRYITGELAKRWKLATARIDFDYLNADYPVLAPGHLLWSFGQQLRAYDNTQAARASFDDADDLLRKLHLELRATPVTRQRGTENLLFGQALNLYLEALNLLPQRVLLIVDTCEELAKVAPDGTAPENVVETFRILCALHDGSRALGISSLEPREGLGNKLRVIFSGRRPLSQQGAGWRSAAQHLERRPYLQLHEIRGFTQAEARRYLLNRAKVHETYIDAIIAKSGPEAGRVPGLSFDRVARQNAQPRCNPFELKLYADWSKEAPAPTPQELREAKNSQYVQQRILRRLGFEVSAPMLQAMALLGHFDADTLRAIAGSERFDAALHRLQQQEWVFQRNITDDEGRAGHTVLGVEPGVRKRLLDYFAERRELYDVSRRAADHLEQLTRDGDLGSLNWSHFDAALRVLEFDPQPQRASEWWVAIEHRLRQERSPAWALNVLGFLQGPDGAAARCDRDAGSNRGSGPESSLRAAVLATYASALRHVRPSKEIDGLWAEVAAKATRVPLPELAEQLAIRARAGRVAACRFTGRTPRLGELKLPSIKPATMDPETRAGLLSAIEELLEDFERRPRRIRKRDADLVLTLLTDGQESPGFWACGLAARFLTLIRRPKADEMFRMALNQSGTVPPNEPWYSLVLPKNPRARIAIEFARTMCPAFLSPVQILRDLPDDLPTDSIDSDRLQSALIRLRAAEASFDAEMLSAIERRGPAFNASVNDGTRRNAHAQLPPSGVVRAEVLCSHGRLSGLAWLRRAARQRDGQEARRALARVARRLRLPAESIALTESPIPGDRALLWAGEALSAVQVRTLPLSLVSTDATEWLHAIWQTSTPKETTRIEALLTGVGDTDRDERLVLDRLEASVLSGRSSEVATSRISARVGPEVRLRHYLRREALIGPGSSNPPPSLWSELTYRLGMRRAAEIALEEAELMSLRLPRKALSIVAHGVDWFACCGDHFGQLSALLVKALLQARLREANECAADLDKLKPSYEALRSYTSDLPAFEAIEEFACRETPVEASVQDWIYLLARLAFCQLVQRQAKQPYRALDAAPLRRRLEQLMGGTLDGQTMLPVEFENAFVESVASTGARSVRLAVVRQKPRWRRVLERGLAVSFVLLGLGGLLGTAGGLIAGLFWVLRSTIVPTLQEISNSQHGAPAATGVALALLIGAGFAARVLWNSSSFLRLRITASGEATLNSPTPVQVNLEQAIVSPWIELRLFLLRLSLGGSAASVSAQATLTTTAPYAELGDLLSDVLRGQYSRLAGRLHLGKQAMVIQPASGLYGLPWEAIVARGVTTGDALPVNSPLRFRRETGDQRSRKPVAAHPTQVLSVRAGEAESGIFKRAWSAEGAASLSRGDDFAIEEVNGGLLSAPASARSHILHLFGIAEDAGVGISFRLAAADTSFGARSVEVAKATETALNASDLARACPNMRVCLLQGPVDINEVRRDSDRRRAALARSFAGELFEQGIPVVIVVPSLDASFALQVATKFASALRRRSRAGTSAMQSAVEQVRNLLITTEGGTSTANWERAYDICLYAEARWDGSWRD